MTYQEFLQTKVLFDQGLVNIKNTYLDAFLYDNKWYPIRAFVNQVHANMNNHESIKNLLC